MKGSVVMKALVCLIICFLAVISGINKEGQVTAKGLVDFAAGDFEYEILTSDQQLKDFTVSVKEYTGSEQHVVVPDKVVFENITYEVTQIGKKEGMPDDMDPVFSYGSFESISVPDSVTIIGSGAFAYSEQLKNIELPASVEYIGVGVLYGCKELTRIQVDPKNQHYKVINGGLVTADGTQLILVPISSKEYKIPDTITSIGALAFAMNETSNIDIPVGIIHIKVGAFKECKNLLDISLPEGLLTIGRRAFSYCPKLMSVSIPKSVKTLSGELFYGSYGLNTVKLSSGLKTIGASAFFNSGLKSIQIPETVTSIGSYAFANSHLSKIKISRSVKIIGEGAFEKCSKLKEITLSQGLEQIGDYAFYENEGLKSMHIPASVKKIGLGVFGGCKALKTISIGAGNKSYKVKDNMLYTKSGKTLLLTPTPGERFTIPKGVTTLREGAFPYCNDLKELIIPSAVKVIYAPFYHCESIQKIQYKGETPPVLYPVSDGTRAFYLLNKEVKKIIFEVPRNSVKTYNSYLKDKISRDCKVTIKGI